MALAHETAPYQDVNNLIFVYWGTNLKPEAAPSAKLLLGNTKRISIVKADTVFKRAYNDSLDLLSSMQRGDPVPTEVEFSRKLGVSRTTVRKVLETLQSRGIVAGSGRNKLIQSKRKGVVRFSSKETVATADQVERRFMEWMLRDNAKPGMLINELQLARQFGVATTGIREFLNRFQRFGLIEKRPNAGWVFKGFTAEFALELFEIREMFEIRSARAFAALPLDSPHWKELSALRAEHAKLLKVIDVNYYDFSDLDRRLHQLITSSTPNRFIDGFYDVIALVFHYHYQWNKRDEKDRNRAAILEHLEYIDALISRDINAIERSCRRHLNSARTTLLRSTAQS